MVNMAFVNQAASDIHCKLQRLEGFKGKRFAKMVAVAQKVYNNREAPGDKQRDWLRSSWQHPKDLMKNTTKESGIWKYK